MKVGKVSSVCLVHGRHSINTALPGPQRMMTGESTWGVRRDLRGHLALVAETEMGKEKGKRGRDRWEVGKWRSGRNGSALSKQKPHHSAEPPSVLILGSLSLQLPTVTGV